MENKEKFGRFGAIMAMAGSAVGLGNMWRFPYLLGEHGGAAFLFVYMLFALLIALPLFLCEFIVGRRGGANCRGAYEKLSGGKGGWKHLGLLAVITCTIIFSYYSVIGGWCIEYFFRSCTFGFSADLTSEDLSNVFSSFVTSVWPPLLGFVFFVVLTCAIVRRGVKNGIERFGKVAMPILALIVVAIAVYVAFLPGAREGYIYMFKPDFSKLDGSVLLDAMGQAFFSLSLGCGCIITYASYVRKKENILTHSVETSVIDVVFAIIAGCAIMPAVFAFGVNPGSGPSLVYETLPFIFSRMPAGNFIAIIFFGALLVATLTSSISMCEVVVAYFTQEKGLSRNKAIALITAIAIAVGSLCSLSFGPLSSFTINGSILFDFFDSMASNFFMVIGAMTVSIFVGWKMKKADVFDEFTSGGTKKFNTRVFPVVLFLIRYVTPIAILVIFVSRFF